MAVRLMRGARRQRGFHGLLGMFLLSAAIVVGAIIVSRRLGAAAPPAAPAPIVAGLDTVMLPVPVEPVPSGTRLKSVRFKRAAYPKEQLALGAVSDVAAVIEGVTTAALPANVPLFRSNISFTGAGNPVTERIPPGMRAMTMRVDATAAVEGWAGSGTTVDVLLIEKDRTTVVAERVKVLSAERSISPIEGSSAPPVPSTVTLLVSQEQCLAIHTAIPRGKIAFALRSSRDDERWGDTVFTSARLSGEQSAPSASGVITGFAAVRDVRERRTFALANGRWIATEVVPDGFRASFAPERGAR